jgi:NTE family protein
MTTAFVLSGGGNLGPMQAGTVLALEEAGIHPDLLVGTSVGSLNAGFLSTRPGVSGARTLVEAWNALRRREAVQLNPVRALAGFLGMRNHLISPTQLRRLIGRWIEVDRIEDAHVPLAVTATDALTGEAVVFTNGSAADCLAASSAIPGLFPPVRIGTRWFIDGSLSANRPVLQAQALGADRIFVITTSTAERLVPPRGAVAMAMNSVSLITSRTARSEFAQALRHAESTGGHIHVVPSSEPAAPGPFDYGRSASLAEGAYRRTRRWLRETEPFPAPPQRLPTERAGEPSPNA